MLSPLNISSDASGFTASNFTQKESIIHSSSTSGPEGKSSYRYEYSSESSSYTVSFSGTGNGSGEQSGTLTYSNINQSYQFSSLSVSAPVEVTEVEEPQPLLDGANNILQFIEQRLSSEQADGASPEELEELIEQGLQGFFQGFEEAKEILKGSGELTDEAFESIVSLYHQVLDGFDALTEKYVNGSGSDDSTDTGPVTDNTTAPSSDVNSVPAAPAPTAPTGNVQSLSSNGQVNGGQGLQFEDQFKVLGNSSRSSISSLINSLDVDVEAATVEYGRKDSFSFELTTLDGDKISIEAGNTAVFYGEYGDATGSDDTDALEGFKDNSQFAIDVTGDLDEQETAAIQDLLDQILSLSDEFYNGDVNKAYEAALDLNYDQNEIASYAVNLRQTEQYSVAAAYQELQPVTDRVEPEGQDALSTIGDFARSVLEALNNPHNYEVFDFTQLLSGISEQIDQQIKDSGPSFHEAIAGLVSNLNDNNLDAIADIDDDSESDS